MKSADSLRRVRDGARPPACRPPPGQADDVQPARGLDRFGVDLGVEHRHPVRRGRAGAAA
jgi:hypothetical protein